MYLQYGIPWTYTGKGVYRIDILKKKPRIENLVAIYLLKITSTNSGSFIPSILQWLSDIITKKFVRLSL
jgi:hypothetical protein